MQEDHAKIRDPLEDKVKVVYILIFCASHQTGKLPKRQNGFRGNLETVMIVCVFIRELVRNMGEYQISPSSKKLVELLEQYIQENNDENK